MNSPPDRGKKIFHSWFYRHRRAPNLDRKARITSEDCLAAGKNYDSIYKTLSNPHKGLDSNNPQNALKDMEYIKSHFEKLGLPSIAQKITNDMAGTL